MKRNVVALLSLLLLSSLIGCGAILEAAKQAAEDDKKTKTVVSSHKTLELTVPGGWKENADLHEEDELGVCNAYKEQYVILLDESKEDFDDMTLEQHADLTLGAMKENLKNPDVSERVSLTINGMPAVQSVLKGSVDGNKIVFLHTTVETSGSFCQVLAWTLNSKWDDNEKVLRGVVESLKEVGARTPTPSTK